MGVPCLLLWVCLPCLERLGANSLATSRRGFLLLPFASPTSHFPNSAKPCSSVFPALVLIPHPSLSPCGVLITRPWPQLCAGPLGSFLPVPSVTHIAVWFSVLCPPNSSLSEPSFCLHTSCQVNKWERLVLVFSIPHLGCSHNCYFTYSHSLGFTESAPNPAVVLWASVLFPGLCLCCSLRWELLPARPPCCSRPAHRPPSSWSFPWPPRPEMPPSLCTLEALCLCLPRGAYLPNFC